MINLATPNLGEKERAHLNSCIDSSFVSTSGAFIDKFSSEVATLSGASFCTVTNTGTSALHIALKVADVNPGDLVILPSFTFIASANAISYCGASPWLFDISKKSWTIDVKQLKDKILSETEKTAKGLIHRATQRKVSAIMPVYTLGNPADMDEIKNISIELKLPIIADAAASLGAKYKGREIGSLADLTTFSFNGNKTFTCGGGGAIVSENKEYIETAQHLATTARIDKNYNYDVVGYNYRLTNIQAAVGCAQLEKFDQFIKAKQAIRKKYNEFASVNCDLLSSFPVPEHDDSACWFSGYLLSEKFNLLDVCDKLSKYNIETRPFWKPIHLQTPYKNCPLENLDVTNSIWHQILTLPCSTHLSIDEQNHVLDSLSKVLKP